MFSTTASGAVTTLAGSGKYGWVDGSGTVASFNYLTGVAASPNGAEVHVAEQYNLMIRSVTSELSLLLIVTIVVVVV